MRGEKIPKDKKFSALTKSKIKLITVFGNPDRHIFYMYCSKKLKSNS